MPKYEFVCDTCNSRVEINLHHNDLKVSDCYPCKKPMRKIISSPGVHFKGSGFYETDYKGK